MEPYDLNELEGAAIGVVWKLQPCTTYAVRKAFRDSTTAHWNASAGAIYPLIARLAEKGLLDAEEHLHGKRRGVRYRLNASGLEALRRWVGPPVAIGAVSIPGDPMRSRLRFLGCLPPDERLRWVEEALDATAEHTHDLEALRE
ncbi:MAG: PadR family transcriptional regulator, partial [Acidobacteriota bacterium]